MRESPAVRVSRPALPPLERYVESLSRIWESGMLSNHGPNVRELERRFGEYATCDGRVVATANCDLALTLAVAAMDLPQGSHAALPSFGYPSTVHAVEWSGLRPRFVDVDRHDWCLHGEQLEGQLDGVTLILATHMFGVASEVVELQRIAAERGITLVYDAAHAIATRVDGRHVTAYGDASAISLAATKLAPAAEGALTVLRDEKLAERFSLLATSGMREGVSETRGLNAKLSELHAALALLTLSDLERELEARRRLIERYRSHLADAEGVRLQRAPPLCEPSPSYFAVDLGERRERVQAALAARGIEARRYFPPLHLMPRFADASAALPVSEQLGRSLLTLPLYTNLTLDTVDEICEIVLATT